MGKSFNKDHKISRINLNIIGLIAMGLLYIATILVTITALLKPDLNGIFLNNKTGSLYAFGELVSNTNGTTMFNGSASSSNNNNGLYTYQYLYTSNLSWKLSSFGIATIVIVGLALIYSVVVFIIFKVNKFAFANSKSLTVINLGLPFILVIYVFIITMLATPLGQTSWQGIITKIVQTENVKSDSSSSTSTTVGTGETLKIVKTEISTQLIAINNDAKLSISNFYSFSIDSSMLSGGDPTKSQPGMKANGTELSYTGSLVSNYASGSMSVLLGTVLVIALVIPFITKLSTKLNKEFKGVVEQQEQANI